MKNILNQIDREEIQKRLAKLSPDSRAVWGIMNVNQMVRHIADSLKISLGEIKPAGQGKLIERTLIIRLILLGVPPPKGKAQTLPEIDEVANQINPKNLNSERKNLSEVIERFLKSEVIYPHAKFGKLTKKQCGRLAYTHINHHLKQFGV